MANAEEYRWLCDQVNLKYFGEIYKNENNNSYNYFDTPAGKFRLKIIKITKKLHIYEPTKKILQKIRK